MKKEIEYMDMTCKLKVVESEYEDGIRYEIDLLKVECLDVDITDLLTRRNLADLHYKYGKDEELTELELHIMDVNKDFYEIEEGARDAYMMSLRS